MLSCIEDDDIINRNSYKWIYDTRYNISVYYHHHLHTFSTNNKNYHFIIWLYPPQLSLKGGTEHLPLQIQIPDSFNTVIDIPNRVTLLSGQGISKKTWEIVWRLNKTIVEWKIEAIEFIIQSVYKCFERFTCFVVVLFFWANQNYNNLDVYFYFSSFALYGNEHKVWLACQWKRSISN